MYKSTVAALALMSVASAQSTTTLWLVGFDEQPVVASVIASDASATTYSLACAPGTDDSDCGIPTSFTFTQGPSTVHYAYTADAGEGTDSGILETIDLGCKVTNSASGVCIGTVQGNFDNSAMSTATTTSFTDISDLGPQAVTLTGGAIASNTGAPATTTSAVTGSTTPTKSSGSTLSTQTESTSSKSTGTGVSGAAAGTGSSSSRPNISTGGMAMITGHANWAMGGAAAALALAAL